MQAWAALAVFEYLVRQLRFIFHGAKTVLEEEVGNARKQAHGLNAVLFGLFNQRLQNCLLYTSRDVDDAHHQRSTSQL